MAILRYAFLRYSFLRYDFLRYFSLRYVYLRYASLRYAFFRDGYLLGFAIQIWIEVFFKLFCPKTVLKHEARRGAERRARGRDCPWLINQEKWFCTCGICWPYRVVTVFFSFNTNRCSNTHHAFV